MSKVPDIIPVTDLRQDAAAALKRVRASDQPLVITQRGRAAAVMLSVEAYERAEHERQILRLLARGEREIAAAKDLGIRRPRLLPHFCTLVCIRPPPWIYNDYTTRCGAVNVLHRQPQAPHPQRLS